MQKQSHHGPAFNCIAFLYINNSVSSFIFLSKDLYLLPNQWFYKQKVQKGDKSMGLKAKSKKWSAQLHTNLVLQKKSAIKS